MSPYRYVIEITVQSTKALGRQFALSSSGRPSADSQDAKVIGAISGRRC